MAESASGNSAHLADRGVNTIEDNEVEEEGRQFIVCQSEGLLTAKKNKAAKRALQCLGQMEGETTRQISHDFSSAREASIDVRQVDSSTSFRGPGRRLDVTGGVTAMNDRVAEVP
jgi:hypothetical protein